jgi:hypothetical protein
MGGGPSNIPDVPSLSIPSTSPSRCLILFLLQILSRTQYPSRLGNSVLDPTSLGVNPVGWRCVSVREMGRFELEIIQALHLLPLHCRIESFGLLVTGNEDRNQGER